MDTERVIRWATGVTASVVTGIAAYESYRHIAAVSHNSLLAFSIDGMIITSTLVMMAANRAKLETVQLAYVGLWLGIVATVFANIAYGWPHGLMAAGWSTWPAVCFVVSVETIAQLSRRKRKTRTRNPGSIGIRNVEYQAKALANKEPEPADTKEPVSSGPHVTKPKDKVPGIKAIRNAIGCGQPVAYEVQAIMVRDQIDDIRRAKQIRDEEKANGNSNVNQV